MLLADKSYAGKEDLAGVAVVGGNGGEDGVGDGGVGGHERVRGEFENPKSPRFFVV